jgi:hypothetical protein
VALVLGGPSLVLASPALGARAPGDIVTTVAGSGPDAYTANGVPASAALLGNPLAVAVDPAGNIVVPDQDNNVVRVVAEATGTYYGTAMQRGDIYTIAGTGVANYNGDGEPPRSAELSGPSAVAIDGRGDLAITDTGNDIVTFIPVTSGVYFGLLMQGGYIYDIAGDSQPGYFGDGRQALTAMLDAPDGITFDAQGNLVVADTFNDVIRLVVQNTGTDFGMAVQEGDIYTIAGNTTVGYSGDGGPATAAQLNLLPFSGVAVDGQGDLVLSDGGNNAVRMVAARTGVVLGRSVVADHIYTIAGNGVDGYSGNKKPALAAELSDPQGVGVDTAGNVLVADSGNDAVRMVAAASGSYDLHRVFAGNMYTVFGNAITGYSGDGGRPWKAEFDSPTGIGFDQHGAVLVADNGNNVIRRVGPPQPTVTSVLPASGATAGGTKVVIRGANLRGTTSVTFGSTPALSFVVKSGTKIIARTPAEPAGTVAVVVTSAWGSSQGSYTFAG